VRSENISADGLAEISRQRQSKVMSEPLDAARRRLNITPPTLYDALPSADRDGALPAA
jgi:hypothetical protein